MDTRLSDFPSAPRSESESSNAYSAPGSSVISCVSSVSKKRLPLSAQGFFSNPDNLKYFGECADSWLKDGTNTSLDADLNATMRLIFELACQIGIFRTAGRRMSWKEKLWTIGAHWGIEETPCRYDEMNDRPYMLDADMLFERLTRELADLEQARSLAVSDFIRPTTDHHTPPPYRDLDRDA